MEHRLHLLHFLLAAQYFLRLWLRTMDPNYNVLDAHTKNAIRDSCEAHIINMPIHVLVDDGVMTVLYIIRYTRVGCPRTSKSRLTILRSPIQKA
jgi:hypothetical protein